MDHAITVGMVLWFVGGSFGLIALGALLLLIVDLMNPFRSGH